MAKKLNTMDENERERVNAITINIHFVQEKKEERKRNQ
jgi:hypothetical protein